MNKKKELKILINGEEVYIQLFEEKASLSEMVEGVADNFDAVRRERMKELRAEEEDRREAEAEEERNLLGYTEADYEYMGEWNADSMEEAVARENEAER